MYNALPFHTLNDAELLMEFGVYTSRRYQIIASAPHNRDRGASAWAYWARLSGLRTNGAATETRCAYDIYSFSIDGSYVI
ncbi:hypothetical protein C8R46DRAFT_1220394 [Mycena filopes]|nr:hypothetical protein C8R46DRAFT_1221991 [Mycena filopes]KAJ7165261.1 hypothetical protein C8R46DRAFT_1220394 [Mycena filopes]